MQNLPPPNGTKSYASPMGFGGYRLFFYQGRINSEQDFLGIRRHFDIYDKKKLIQ